MELRFGPPLAPATTTTIFLPAAFEYLPVAAGNKIADKTDPEPRPLRRF